MLSVLVCEPVRVSGAPLESAGEATAEARAPVSALSASARESVRVSTERRDIRVRCRRQPPRAFARAGGRDSEFDWSWPR